MNKAQATAWVEALKASILAHSPDATDDFAEATALYLTFNGLGIGHANDVSFQVWLRGEKGLEEHRKALAALPDTTI